MSNSAHMSSPHVTAVTCVKNEGPFLLEWIAYHQVIGVDTFVFYSNDCDDGTDHLLDHLAKAGIVTHLPNPAQGRHYQMEALSDAQHRPELRRAQWVMVTDVDEFLHIKIGDGHLSDLFEACGTPEALSIPFQYFGNGGIDAYVDEPILTQFTWAENPDLHADHVMSEVKTLTHYKFPLRYYGAHQPFMNEQRLQNKKIPHWTDASGQQVNETFIFGTQKEHRRQIPAKGAARYASLHHYALRSKESYLVKNDRGDVNRENRAFDASYWNERNDCAYENREILRHLPALMAQIGRLKSLPHVATAHAACVANHRTKIDALKTTPQYQTLWDSLPARSVPSRAEANLFSALKEGTT